MRTKVQSPRRMGREIKATVWTARHPGTIAAPGALVASGTQFGWSTTGTVLGGTAGVLGCWYRAHPNTFDAVAAPRMRAWWRRWRVYLGPRWNNALRACDLYTTNRKTGEERFPRIVKVRSYTPSVDTLYVKLVPGQKPAHFEAHLEELAQTLKVERIAVERVKPGLIGLVIERSEPFTEVIAAPEMPGDSEAVDLKDLYIGEDEFGGEWRMPLLGQHIFGAGATGAGKNSVVLSILRGLAPMVRDGLVRLWICDPKQMEFAELAPIAHRYATDGESCTDLVNDYVEDMKATQRGFSGQGIRKVTVSPETPLNVLILDEIGALLAYGDPGTARELRKSLSLVGSQGRATGHSMIALVQEPTKDVVSVRDLFTVRFCLRLSVAGQVDGVLGEGARLRGALADEIPNTEDTAGVGYVIRQRTRVPLRVRAAYVADHEITELVALIHTGHTSGDNGLRVVA